MIGPLTHQQALAAFAVAVIAWRFWVFWCTVRTPY
jgi:hypothetical protein